MAGRVQIKCIVKEPRLDPYKSITHVGGGVPGGYWQQTQQQTIREIESGAYEYYADVNGKQVDVIVATHSGHKYIKTKPDGVDPNNLLSLPDCNKR